MNYRLLSGQKNKIWIAVNHCEPGIRAWAVGDSSAKTFELMWQVVSLWGCYFYVTDGYKVYPNYIPEGDQIVRKTYMTRVEGENCRLRNYLARLHRKTWMADF